MGSRGNSSYNMETDKYGMAQEMKDRYEVKEVEVEKKEYANEKIEFYRLSLRYEKKDVFFELDRKNIDKISFDLGGEEIKIEGKFSHEENEEYLKLKKQSVESSMLPYVYYTKGQYNMAQEEIKVEGEKKNENFYFDLESNFEFSQGIFNSRSSKKRFYIDTFNEEESENGNKYQVIIKQDNTKNIIEKVKGVFEEILNILEQAKIIAKAVVSGNLVAIVIEGTKALFMAIDSLEKMFNILNDSEYLNNEVNYLKSLLSAAGAYIGREIDRIKRESGRESYTGDDAEIYFENATYEFYISITTLYSIKKDIKDIEDAKNNIKDLDNENINYETWLENGQGEGEFNFSSSLIIRAKKGEKLNLLEGLSGKKFYLDQYQSLSSAYEAIGSKTINVLQKLSSLTGNPDREEIGSQAESGAVVQNQYNVEIKKNGEVIYKSSTGQIKLLNFHFDMDDNNAKGSREREVIIQIMGELPFVSEINNIDENYKKNESIVEGFLFSRGQSAIYEVNVDVYAVDGEKEGTSLTHEANLYLKEAILIDYSENYACAEKDSLKGKNESFIMKFKPWNNSYENIEITQIDG